MLNLTYTICSGIVNILPGFLHATFIMFISLHRLIRCIRRLSFKMDRFLTARKASVLSGKCIRFLKFINKLSPA